MVENMRIAHWNPSGFRGPERDRENRNKMCQNVKMGYFPEDQVR